MSTYYYAIDAEGDFVFHNVPEEHLTHIFNFKDSNQSHQILLDKTKTRIGRIARKQNSYGTIYTLSTEPRFINSASLFKEIVDKSVISLKSTIDFQRSIKEAEIKKTEEFTHNLTSLNTYGIQDLFTLIPQRTLTENINTQNQIVQKIIVENPAAAVKTILKLIKYNLAMKVEFSVFDRTLKPYAVAQKMNHSIRAFILSILQIFISDFENKKIQVTVDASEKMLSIDYDSLFVSFYYIFDNAVKYCCPNTIFKILFKEEPDAFSVVLIMISIPIEKLEIDRLFERGYRSPIAKHLNQTGQGIGMYRIVKTLKLNDVVLEITPKINEFTKKIEGIQFQANQFKLKFIGQQDWFIVQQLKK